LCQGEAIRLACNYGNLPWEDVRVTFDQFNEMKADGLLAFGQLPALQVSDGPILCQSAAILRFVGRYAGLYPVDDYVKAAIIDSVIDEEIDLFTGIAVTRYKG
jgi:glutathione S-transferase